MRKLIIATALTALALGGASACASNSPTPETTPTPSAPAEPADQEAVCTAAQAATTEAISDLTAVFMSGGGTVPTDPAAQQQLLAQLTGIATPWIATMTDLSKKDISPELAKALTDATATIPTLATVKDTTEALAKVNEITGSITAACAG